MISRRGFFGQVGAAAAGVIAGKVARGAGAGASSDEDYRDRVTGARVRVLTPPGTRGDVIYQTHPMWVRDMQYLVFPMEKDGVTLPYARQMASGLLRPVTLEPVGANVVHRGLERLYFVRERAVYWQNIVASFQRMAESVMAAPLPPYVDGIAGGLSVDASGKVLYAGFRYPDKEEWGIAALDFRTNLWREVTRTGFQVGHVQAHPTLSGVLLFCHETGGDAPQRMWRFIEGDSEAKPFFVERLGEWVTHEVWWANREARWGLNRVLFTIWPYDEEREKRQYGIASVDGDGRDFTIVSRFKAWHTHGSPNGEWILGDDHERNIWLIKPWSSERRLLTQGHRAEGFDTHPHASFTPDSRGVVMNSSAVGREAVVLVEIPEWEGLPVAPS